MTIEIRVPDTAPFPSVANRLGTVTLVGALGVAGEAPARLGQANDLWMTPLRTNNAIREEGCINVRRWPFEAKGDFNLTSQTGTDDTQAFLDAVDAAKTLIAHGQLDLARMIGPPGNYLLTEQWDLDFFNLRFWGYGTVATALVIDHDAVGVRTYRSSSEVKHCRIVASTDRAALSYDVRRIGLLHLGPTGAVQSDACLFEDLLMDGHPGPGGLFVISLSEFRRIKGYTNKGHGLCWDTGEILRAVLGDFGLSSGDIEHQGGNDILLPRAFTNGGHGVAIGHPDDTGTVSIFRNHVRQFDGSGNATNASARYTVDDNFLRGVGVWADDGVGAGSGAGAAGWALSGRNVKLRNHRVVGSGEWAARVKAYTTGSQLTTLGVEVELDTVVSPPAPLNPAVKIDAVGLSVDVAAKQSANITALAEAGFYSSSRFGEAREVRGGNSKFDALGGIFIGTIADDAFKTLEFSSALTGAGCIWSETQPGRMAWFFFGVGASPFCNLQAALANVTCSTGALTTGTGDGVDTDLNINAHTDNKLYIKNRTGSARVYNFIFFANLSTARVIAVV